MDNNKKDYYDNKTWIFLWNKKKWKLDRRVAPLNRCCFTKTTRTCLKGSIYIYILAEKGIAGAIHNTGLGWDPLALRSSIAVCHGSDGVVHGLLAASLSHMGSQRAPQILLADFTITTPCKWCYDEKSDKCQMQYSLLITDTSLHHIITPNVFLLTMSPTFSPALTEWGFSSVIFNTK